MSKEQLASITALLGFGLFILEQNVNAKNPNQGGYLGLALSLIFSCFMVLKSMRNQRSFTYQVSIRVVGLLFAGILTLFVSNVAITNWENSLILWTASNYGISVPTFVGDILIFMVIAFGTFGGFTWPSWRFLVPSRPTQDNSYRRRRFEPDYRSLFKLFRL